MFGRQIEISMSLKVGKAQLPAPVLSDIRHGNSQAISHIPTRTVLAP